jgi:hypothetical protein
MAFLWRTKKNNPHFHLSERPLRFDRQMSRLIALLLYKEFPALKIYGKGTVAEIDLYRGLIG